jgi:amicyanin
VGILKLHGMERPEGTAAIVEVISDQPAAPSGHRHHAAACAPDQPLLSTNFDTIAAVIHTDPTSEDRMLAAPRRLAPLLAAPLAVALVASLASAARAADASVQIADMAFAADDVTVSVGDTVTWTNMDPMVHTVTSTTGDFDSGDLGEGESYSVTFTAPGTYAYLCTPHPFMTGTVTVVAAAAAPAPSTAPNASGEVPNVAMAAPPGGPTVPFVVLGLALVAVATWLGIRAGRSSAALANDGRAERRD